MKSVKHYSLPDRFIGSSDIMEPSTQDTSDSTSCSVFELTDEGWVVNAGNCNDSLPFICQDKAGMLTLLVINNFYIFV